MAKTRIGGIGGRFQGVCAVKNGVRTVVPVAPKSKIAARSA
jgi:hypothetical protein